MKAIDPEEIKGADETASKFKLRKIIRALEGLKGVGSTMVTLTINPDETVEEELKFIQAKISILSGWNTGSKTKGLKDSLLAVKEKLSSHSKIPANGLVIYSGILAPEDGQEQKNYVMEIVPYKSIPLSLFNCGDCFDLTPLKEIVGDHKKYGFIILNFQGAIIAYLQGNNKVLLQKIVVELPRKTQRRGGASAMRFVRLNVEKIYNFFRKTAEFANQDFIANGRPNVEGIIIGGTLDMKDEIQKYNLLDPALRPRIIKTVFTSYAFEPGLDEAITLSDDAIKDCIYSQGITVIRKFFQEVSSNSSRVVSGIGNSLKLLEANLVEEIIVWENTELMRITVKHEESLGGRQILYIKKSKISSDGKLCKDSNGASIEIIEAIPLSEWLAENANKFKTKVHFVSEKSHEGLQFIQTFDGCGGFLRFDFPQAIQKEESRSKDKAEDGFNADPEAGFI